MLPPVETVAGRYRLTALLGKGGMGSVWRAEHESLGTDVAVKLLDPRLAERPGFRARFEREAKAAAALRSKHVVKVIDHGVEGEVPFIVLEMLHGESLATRLRRTSTIDPETFARIFVQTGRALAKAHAAGIVHRDLKPDNLWLADLEEETDTGVGERGFCVKVLDFGIAKALQDGALDQDLSTETGTMLGTPHYMSPEQLRASKSIDALADLWSLAVIAFQCLTGSRPFAGDAIGELVLRICGDDPPVPSSIAPVPPGFDAWFARATARKPADRYPNVGELVRALEDVLTPGTRTFDTGAQRSDVSTLPDPTSAPTVLALEPPPAAMATPADPIPTIGSASRSVPPAPRRPRSAVVVGVTAVVVATSATLGYLALTREPTLPASSSSAVRGEEPRASAVESGAPGAPAGSPQASAAPIPSVSTITSAAAPKAIVLTIRSKPPGAEVFRGAERLGEAGAPITLPWSDQPLELIVRRPGYLPKRVTAPPRETVELDVALEAPRPVNTETPL